MKRLSKIEKEVMAIHDARCPETPNTFTQSFADWADATMEHYAFRMHGNMVWCSHCGHEYREENRKEHDRSVCPHCGREVGISSRHITKYDNMQYLMDAHYVGDWQIIDVFLMQFYSHRPDYKMDVGFIPFVPQTSLTKVFERYFNVKTHKQVCLSRGIKGFSAWRTIPFKTDDYATQWYMQDCACKTREVKLEFSPKPVRPRFAYCKTSWYDEWFMNNLYPHYQIHPIFRRMGLNKVRKIFANDKNNNASGLLDTATALLGKNGNCIETLLKLGDKHMARYAVLTDSDKVAKYWKQYLIAHRHGFKFSSNRVIRDWFDQINELEYLGMDINSPKYIAPTDFKASHQQIVAMANNKRERERRKAEMARMRAEIERNKIEVEKFYKRLTKYFGLEFSNENLVVFPLKSPQEYTEEGAKMHHCVGGYWKGHDDSLILTARNKTDGKRVETIEVNTKSWTIIQSRGADNNPTEHHDEIINLINANMDSIKAVSRSRKAVSA